MGDKFLGIGLKNAVGLFFLFMLLNLVLKTVFAKHYVEGASEAVLAS